MYFHPLLRLNLSNISVFQAVVGVSASYDALIDLFECIENFLGRLRIYIEIPFSPSMSGITQKSLLRCFQYFPSQRSRSKRVDLVRYSVFIYPSIPY